jgi:hypothetical protein
VRLRRQSRHSNLEPRAPGASFVTELREFLRYARRLHSFVRQTLSPAEARTRIERQLQGRETTFLTVLEHAVYRNPDSPYVPLLRSAGAEFGDVSRLVRTTGLEAALGKLYDEGVYVTLDEFKGRVPLERSGLSLQSGHRAFDNPLLTSHFQIASGGSRGVRRRFTTDLELLDYEAASHLLFLEAFELGDRPFALWRVHPPSASGVTNSLRHVKCGRAVAAWFTPYKAPRSLESLKFAAFTNYTVRIGRLLGGELALPEYCAPDDAARVAHWLAERTREGKPAFCDTQAGLGVRVCLAAKTEGLDISGTFFRFGGEPFTEGKAAVVADAGCRAVCHYTMGETGRIAVACADPETFDDMHFLSDKLAVLQRDKNVGSGAIVGAFHFTSLMPSSPKVLINVESDDYGELSHRRCNCPLDRVGLTTHIRGVRSYEKLTSEGNHFLGSDLIALLDRVLPGRFGGDPGDYQLVEEEIGGLPKVSVVIHPALGELDERDVVTTVLDHLRLERRNQLMADVWRDAHTLRVVRREPYMTPSGKILPLYIAAGE